MHYYNSMKDLIGHTPLVKINYALKATAGVQVFSKLELYNPSGSVKDRTGLYTGATHEILTIICANQSS